MATEFFELTADKPSLGEQKPLFGSDRNLVSIAFALGALLVVWKVYMATLTPVIWDEAHFVMSGQHPDLGYPDIPAGFPLLASLGIGIFGWSIFPLRLVALAISMAIPVAVWFMARPVATPRNSVWAAILAMLCPAITMNGTIFYPEGALQLALALVAGCLLRAIAEDRMKWWISAGFAAAFGLLIHFRFLVPGMAVILFLLVNSQGRALWKKPGLYVTASLALLGLLPAIIYNATNHWPAVQFHVVNRPNYAFDIGYALIFLATQVGIAMPVIFAALVAGARKSLVAEREKPGTLLGYLAAFIFVFYCLQTLFNKKVMPHWPWLAFLPLLPYAPSALIAFADAARNGGQRLFRGAIVALIPLVVLVMAAGFTFMEYAIRHAQQLPYALQTFSSSKKEDWLLLEPALAAARAEAVARFGNDVAFATNGHASAVHLEFPGERGRKVYTLDDPDDLATQFALERHHWGRDRAALVRDRAGKGVVLVLNQPTYVYHQPQEAAFFENICGQFEDVESAGTVDLPPGKVVLNLYTARVKTQEAVRGPCPFLPSLYIARPARGDMLKADDDGHYFGLAADPVGIRSVHVLLDGKVITEARYGLDPEGARAPKYLAFDPNYPKVQFDFDFPKGSLRPGKHMLSFTATRSDGVKIESEKRPLFVE